jgi:hypothetical protein
MAVLLRASRHAGPVTIVPSGPFAGLCATGRGIRPTEADVKGHGGPYVLLSARLRRFWESQMMVGLAGAVAEALYGDEVTPAPAPWVAVRGDEPFVLPERELAIIAQAASAPGRPDAAYALDILTVLHFDDLVLADTHFAFLERETEILMATRRAEKMIRALTAQLLIHRTLPAARWKKILRDAM